MQLALPKGRMQEGVFRMLADAGIEVKTGAREYRPIIGLENYDVKLLKPQNIIEMLSVGSRDIGFAGLDWVQNLGLENQIVELLDTKLDPVKVIVAGKSREIYEAALNDKKHVIIASEYEKLTLDWIKAKGINATFVRSFGATESFPPEDADLIVDNTATGSTLKANGLEIFDVVTTSSTRLFCSVKAHQDPAKRQRIEDLVVLINSVLLARSKALIEFNVDSTNIDRLLENLPSMRAPSISKLHNDAGFAIRVAVDKVLVSTLVPQLKAAGATDILVNAARQIVR